MAAISLACVARGPALDNPGASTANNANIAASRPRATPLPVPGATWEGMALLPTLRPAGGTFASRGHYVDHRTAAVLTNDLASVPYAGRFSDAPFPVGALLVERNRQPRSEAEGPLFVMKKREPGYFEDGGDWEYAVVHVDGNVEARGALAACARCHAEAPSAWVFRRP